MKIQHNKVTAAVEFESFEDAVDAIMSDPTQKQLFEFAQTLHPDDVLIWLEGVLDCADAFNLDVSGLQYAHDEMMEVGVEPAFDLIINGPSDVSSALDISDKLFLVTVELTDGQRVEEEVEAFNARTAKAIVDSIYKREPHTIIEVKSL